MERRLSTTRTGTACGATSHNTQTATSCVNNMDDVIKGRWRLGVDAVLQTLIKPTATGDMRQGKAPLWTGMCPHVW